MSRALLAVLLSVLMAPSTVSPGTGQGSIMALTATLQRFIAPPQTVTTSATAYNVIPAIQFFWNISTPVDFTIRIACPQLEYGSQTSPASLPNPGNLIPSSNPLSPDSAVFTTPVGIYGLGGITNFIDNPNSEGAVIGTIGSGGVLPTHWSVSYGAVATQIVATGVSDPDMGLPYIDLRIFGTSNTAGGTIRFALQQAIPSIAGDVWVLSTYVALVGGNLTNVTQTGHVIYFYDQNNVTTGNTTVALYTPTATLQRFSAQRTVSGATTRRVWPTLYFSWPNTGVAIDFTLRIAAPQLENNLVVTPPILPPLGSPGVTTRGIMADAAVGNFVSIQGWPTIITANAIRLAYGTSTVLGSPTIITVTPTASLAASATVLGSPTIITATPTARLPASVTPILGDDGGVNANAIRLAYGIATVLGSPTIITATATLFLPASATVLGSPTIIQATASLLLPASATIAGTGGDTNWIPNPRGEGGTVGTIGSGGVLRNQLPSQYGWRNNAPVFLGQFIVNGIPCTRWQYSGTATDTNSLGINPWRSTAFVTGLTAGSTQTESFYVRLVAGDATGINAFRTWGDIRDATNAVIAAPANIFLTPTTLTRIVAGWAPSGGVPPYNVVGVGTVIVTNGIGSVINFTIDLGGWQFEPGNLSPMILPPVGAPAATTRVLAADTVPLLAAECDQF